ncbi:MAG: ATP synthase F0 subunit A [Phycisphaeraceae bacterium]|nr:MAG: ATP synthase F0 subunit A [Phycisphaeraceae bacterium]
MLNSVITAAADPLGHVLDKELFGSGTFAFTMNTLSLVVVGIATILLIRAAAKRIEVGSESEGSERYITRGTFSRILEVMVLFLREKVFRPQLGPHTDKFTPFLLTLFFFIWFANLFGMIPLIDLQYLITSLTLGEEKKVIGGTPTGRLAVTGALATIAFVVWHVSGLRMNGVKNWAAHFTAGAPWFIWPVMIPVEIIGSIVKPAALCIRLFANMTAGHVLLAVVLGFTGGAIGAVGLVGGIPVAFVAFLGSVAIFFLEVFVSTLQAFIFTVLTTIFISQMVHHHHEDDHHAESYDGHEHSMATDEAAAVTA